MSASTPVGYVEIAELLKVPRETLWQWRYRRALPPPDFQVNGHDAWKTSTILQWAKRTNRMPDASRAR